MGSIPRLLSAGKVGVSLGRAAVFVHSAEMYPTAIRATALSFTWAVAEIGNIATPILEDASESWPYLVRGLVAIGASVAAFFLPETLGCPLPDNLDEVSDDDDVQPGRP